MVLSPHKSNRSGRKKPSANKMKIAYHVHVIDYCTLKCVYRNYRENVCENISDVQWSGVCLHGRSVY